MENNYLRSPLFYVGDKYKILSEILPHFPKNINRFIEPFTGGGSVFLNVKAKHYYLNDNDQIVVDLHKFLQKYSANPEKFHFDALELIDRFQLSKSFKDDIVPDSLKQEFKKTYFAKFNKVGFNQLKHEFNKESTKDYLKFYLLLIYGFNRMIRFNAMGHYNLPVGNVDYNKNVFQALNRYFEEIGKIQPIWSNIDYKDFLAKTNPECEDFVYLDPPYLITLSEYNKNWNHKQENQLVNTLENLNKNKVRFAISNILKYKGKENTIFSAWAKNYKAIQVKSNYISYHDNTVKNFEEVLVTNYEN